MPRSPVLCVQTAEIHSPVSRLQNIHFDHVPVCYINMLLPSKLTSPIVLLGLVTALIFQPALLVSFF
jgi:hypothetical protein